MKFRALVGILTVSIIALFAMVVKFSLDLKESQQSLEDTNAALVITVDSLELQKGISDSLTQVTKEHLNILARATDSIYFSVAKRANTFKSYRTYVNTIGKDGAYYNASIVNMTSFLRKEGYVQFTESNGNKMYEKFMATDNFPDEPIFINNKPSVAKNNLYLSKQALRIRKGVIGNPDYPNSGPTGDVVKVDQLVMVLDIIESGDATWAHIAYGN